MERAGRGDSSPVRAVLIALVLAGCGGTAGSGERAIAPRPGPPARCTVVLVTDAVDAVARIGGGAFVLREGGLLERYDREGANAGVARTELRSIAAAGAYVCGEAGEGVACFRDRREDLTCPAARFAPELEAVPVPSGNLRGDRDAAIVWDGETAWEIGGTCEQHCVSLGCDEPRRCMDPCPPGVRPRLFARRFRAPAPVLSNNRTARVTHPSK